MNKRFWGVLWVLVFAGVRLLAAAAPEPGTTRDEVILRHGEPNSTITLGDREVLSYANGKVTLREGKVVSADFTDAPAPATAGAKTAARPAPSAPAGGWHTDLDQAKAAAKAGKKRLLVLFTGSTWCPACIKFERLIAHDATFLQTAQKKYVLLKFDCPRSGPPPGSKGRALMEKYGIGGYPAMLTLNADTEDPVPVNVMQAVNAPAGKAPAEMLSLVMGGLDGVPTPAKGLFKMIGLVAAGFALFWWWMKK